MKRKHEITINENHKFGDLFIYLILLLLSHVPIYDRAFKWNIEEIYKRTIIIISFDLQPLHSIYYDSYIYSMY